MTDRTLHFISGLPRSGSTLLGAILSQNPRLSAGMSCPLAPLFDAIVAQVSAGSELSRMVSGEQRARLLRGLFESFYAHDRAEVVFDTNRAWTARMPELMALFPGAKVICCVRDVAWVMDSLERQYRGNAFENTLLFNSAAERSTVYTRTDALAAPNRRRLRLPGAARGVLEHVRRPPRHRRLRHPRGAPGGRPGPHLRLSRRAALLPRLRERHLRRARLRHTARPRRAPPGSPEGRRRAAGDRAVAGPVREIHQPRLLA